MKKGIKDLIFEIRGKQVMLDSDVAKLYGYETKRINEIVRRNIERFPEEFCFRLTKEEYHFLLQQKTDNLLNNWSQIATSSKYKYRGFVYIPLAFTEQGIAMLSGLLKNEIAVKVSISIMNAFVAMRKFIINNAAVFERLTTVEYKMLEYDNNFDKIFDALQKEENIKQKIFFDGQIYDSYSLLIDIIKKANKEIIIIENYVDKTILDLLAKKNKDVSVTIIGTNNLKLSELDIAKFNEQYPKLNMKYSDSYHDRFIIIDNDIIYHLGASLKDLGKKTFGINIIEDKCLLNNIFTKQKNEDD